MMQNFDSASEFIEQILRVKDTEDVPMVLVGNKCDLEDQREVMKQEGEDWAREKQFPFFEASAKENTNVEECFAALVKRVVDYKLKYGKQGKDKCVLC